MVKKAAKKSRTSPITSIVKRLAKVISNMDNLPKTDYEEKKNYWNEIILSKTKEH